VFRPAEGSPAGLHMPGTPAGAQTSYAQPTGTVYDSQPRIISNLIADQTLNNPAAIAGALAAEGITGSAALAIIENIQQLREAADAAHDAVDEAEANAQTAFNSANAIVTQSAAVVAAAQLELIAANATLASAEGALAEAQAALAAAETAAGLQAPAVAAAQNAGATTLADRDAAQTVATGTENAKTIAYAALALREQQAQLALEAFEANPDAPTAAAYAAADELRDDAATAYALALDADEDADAALVAAQAAHADAVQALQTALATQTTLAAAVASAGTAVDAALQTRDNAAAAVGVESTELAAANAALVAATTLRDAVVTGPAATAAAEAAAEAADDAVFAELESHGIALDGVNVVVPNVSADLGDTAPYNSFFTIFGQFFDHGLDLTTKGGNGQVIIPLQPDDPLYGTGPTNFMVMTRATNQPGPDGVRGTADDIRENANETTPWIDLNQVYTSNASHQVFLREYASVGGRPVSTGAMLEGSAGGPPSWADVKDQAL
ncbi:MAG: hypothetical protein C0489_11730, partial [Candidatus Accumulibacter sp.]|nr:hypothetical protein [Accumulibacter sp.]